MTKKHYIQIAYSLKRLMGEVSAIVYVRLVNDLADQFAEDNARFSREEFLRACGVYRD